MNLGDVKVRVKRQFGDESAVQVTDDDIVRWANDAQRFACLDNDNLLEKISATDLVAGQQDYDQPVDLQNLKSIHIKNDPGELSYIHMQGFDLQKFDAQIDGWDGSFYGPGMTFIYTVFADKVKVFPTPDTSVVAGLKFYYNRKPVNLVSDIDVIDLPEMYHSSVVDFCLQQAYEMDENLEASVNKQAQVSSQLRVAKGYSAWNNKEFYPEITVANPDDLW